jgi:dihydrofolate synthase / folylpolyglutamate synthase
MSYSAAVDSLHMLAAELHSKPGEPRHKFRLEEMRTLMAALGDPQLDFHSVLIAGTNGKGSTAASLSSIVAQAGYRTGLYTSPHLARVNERIRLNGVVISDDAFAELYFRIDDVAQGLVANGALPAHPSYFETMTALAFLYFSAQRVDLAVLEVGMGGRLDATNIVEPLLSIITDISLDHTEWLGSTISAIAHEKAGILRKDGVMITLPQHPEANQALGEVAVALNVRGVNAASYLPVQNHPERYARNLYPLSVMGEGIEIDSPLAGVHQQRNLALAIAAAVELRTSNSYNITALNVEAGIRATQWPGRLEYLAGDGLHAPVLLDVAHNPAGAWALRSALSNLELPEGKGLTLIFGCLRDKAVGEIAQILFPMFDRVVLTPVNSPRTASMEEMMAAANPTGVPITSAPDAAAALHAAVALTPTDGLIVGTGSVYLVGDLRSLLTPAETTS